MANIERYPEAYQEMIYDIFNEWRVSELIDYLLSFIDDHTLDEHLLEYIDGDEEMLEEIEPHLMPVEKGK